MELSSFKTASYIAAGIAVGWALGSGIYIRATGYGNNKFDPNADIEWTFSIQEGPAAPIFNGGDNQECKTNMGSLYSVAKMLWEQGMSDQVRLNVSFQ